MASLIEPSTSNGHSDPLRAGTLVSQRAPLVGEALKTAATFGALLRCYRIRKGQSVANLAKAAGIDPSYVTRFETGERRPHDVSMLAALCRELDLTPTEEGRLYLAAGYAPPILTRLGDWSLPLQRLCEALGEEQA